MITTTAHPMHTLSQSASSANRGINAESLHGAAAPGPLSFFSSSPTHPISHTSLRTHTHRTPRTPHQPTMSSYRPNPFFSTTHSFFLPSVGDRVDQAIQSTQQLGKDAQAKGSELYNKADLKVQDAKEAVKDSLNPNAPTGADLYARWV